MFKQDITIINITTLYTCIHHHLYIYTYSSSIIIIKQLPHQRTNISSFKKKIAFETINHLHLVNQCIMHMKSPIHYYSSTYHCHMVIHKLTWHDSSFIKVRLFSHISPKPSYMFTHILTCYLYVDNHISVSITTSFHLVKTLLRSSPFSCFKFHSIPSQNQHNQFILKQTLHIIH